MALRAPFSRVSGLHSRHRNPPPATVVGLRVVPRPGFDFALLASFGARLLRCSPRVEDMLIARLQAAGLNATAVQNPLTTLPDAVASAERVLARQDGPTVLVGHSFSGMIVTEAGMHSNVSALVYVAARAPDAGEDYTALAKTFPTPPASAGIVFDGDEGRLGEAAFLRDFAGDLPEAKARVLYAVQQPFQKALLTGKTTQAAWRSKASFYAVSTEDRTINPDLERFMAKRMGAKTIEVKASHLSLISQPDTITALILEATRQA